jgi:hypothetical protein
MCGSKTRSGIAAMSAAISSRYWRPVIDSSFVGQPVLHVEGEVVETSFVEDVQIGAVPGVKIRGHVRPLSVILRSLPP